MNKQLQIVTTCNMIEQQ